MNEHLFVRSNSVLQRILQNDIKFIASEGNYCKIYTLENSYLVKISLSHILTKLNCEKFTQIHRSYIIRLDLIEKVDTIGNRVFIADQEIPIGRKYKFFLLGALNIL